MVTKQEIIIRHHRQGDSERKISRELGISRTTVRSYLKGYQKASAAIFKAAKAEEELIEDLVKAPSYNSFNRGKRKLTIQITQEIDKLLHLNDQKRSQGLHKQILKKIDILDYLTEKGFDIGYTTICNYISEKSNKVKEAYIRQVYKPGEVCEFDWGEVKLVIAGQRKTLNMAVFTPAKSNYRYAMLFHRQDSISFQQAHVNFFEHVGGVYQTMVFDNMRVAIRRFVGPQEKEPTDALIKLSMYYKFGFRFCNIRKGNEKGHVERSVEYVRRKAFSITDSFESLEEANTWLQNTNNKLNTCYNRFAKGKIPMDLFNQEKPFLYPVPPRFDCATLEQSRADKYSTICYSTNHYSVPDNLVGEIIDIKVYPEKLICYHGQQKICEHERQYVHHGWHITLEHYLNTLYRKPGALAGSQALKSAPGNVKLIYENYFKHDSRGFVELLLFAKSNKHDFEDLEKVIKRLKKICPHDISVDKIKALCMQKETGQQNLHDKDDPILRHSNQQLQAYCTLLNQSFI